MRSVSDTLFITVTEFYMHTFVEKVLTVPSIAVK